MARRKAPDEGWLFGRPLGAGLDPDAEPEPESEPGLEPDLPPPPVRPWMVTPMASAVAPPEAGARPQPRPHRHGPRCYHYAELECGRVEGRDLDPPPAEELEPYIDRLEAAIGRAIAQIDSGREAAAVTARAILEEALDGLVS